MSEVVFNEEVMNALQSCKTAQEVVTLAKTKGIVMTEARAQKLLDVVVQTELSDEDLDMVVGGKGGYCDDSHRK